MKSRCEKSELQKSTGIAMHAVPARATMTILECILITADENGILFTTNDAELGIETKVNGEVLEKGTVAVHARMLSEIVRRLPDLPVTIETDDALQVRTNTRLQAMFPSEQRATLISIECFSFSIIMIVLSPLAGFFFSVW